MQKKDPPEITTGHPESMAKYMHIF